MSRRQVSAIRKDAGGLFPYPGWACRLLPAIARPVRFSTVPGGADAGLQLPFNGAGAATRSLPLGGARVGLCLSRPGYRQHHQTRYG